MLRIKGGFGVGLATGRAGRKHRSQHRFLVIQQVLVTSCRMGIACGSPITARGAGGGCAIKQ